MQRQRVFRPDGGGDVARIKGKARDFNAKQRP